MTVWYFQNQNFNYLVVIAVYSLFVLTYVWPPEVFKLEKCRRLFKKSTKYPSITKYTQNYMFEKALNLV